MRTITNTSGNLDRDITNGADLDILETDLPLQIVIDDDGNNSINLGGLSTYGTTGQIMKVNSDADGLEWADDDDTTYTVVSPLTLSTQNAISLSNLTGFGTEGQFLKSGPGNTLVYGSDNNTEYTGGTNISIDDQTNAINLDSIITLDRLNMTEGNAIFFKGSNDLNHYIKYVNDGLEIAGFGSNNAPCFQVVNTKPLADPQPGVPITVFQVFRDKLISKQKLDMTSQPIYFKESDLNHYIKYQSVGDCVELASYSDGANDDVVFQFINKAVTSGDPNLVLINKENNFFVKTTNFQSDVSIKNAKKMIFNDSSSITQSNYIKFNDTYDSMEISGSGLGGDASVLRIVSPNSTPDVLCDFELTKTTFEKPTIFNSDVTIETNLCVNTDLDVLGVATFDSNVTFNRDLTVNQVITCDYLFVNQTIECISLFTEGLWADELFVSDDVRIGKKLHMRDNFSLGEINMADGRIYWRNGYKTGTNTYATDLNHFSTYSGGPVDGIRHQGWNGVALGYTNGGPGTALYTNGSGVFLGNGSPVTSDDRIKFNETKITGGALTTINKLVVVEYDKRYNRDLPETQYNAEMENHLLNDTPQKEYGYIAQDTWNDIPELRFTIKGVDESIPENFVDGRLIEDCKIRNKNPEGEEFIDRKYLSIDYNNINVLNVRAVQELHQIVSQQRAQIDKLETSIEMLLKFNNLSLD